MDKKNGGGRQETLTSKCVDFYILNDHLQTVHHTSEVGFRSSMIHTDGNLTVGGLRNPAHILKFLSTIEKNALVAVDEIH